MLGYFNIDPQGDYGGRRQYSHSAMFVGKLGARDQGRITCHTKSRFGGLSAFPDEWHLDDPAYLYTFIHVARDDAQRFASEGSLRGWWRKGSAGAHFYHFAMDGRVTSTMHPPSPVLDLPPMTINSGHYFVEGSKVTLIWKRGGDVEVWWTRGGGQFETYRNGRTDLRAERWTEARARRPH